MKHDFNNVEIVSNAIDDSKPLYSEVLKHNNVVNDITSKVHRNNVAKKPYYPDLVRNNDIEAIKAGNFTTIDYPGKDVDKKTIRLTLRSFIQTSYDFQAICPNRHGR